MLKFKSLTKPKRFFQAFPISFRTSSKPCRGNQLITWIWAARSAPRKTKYSRSPDRSCKDWRAKGRNFCPSTRISPRASTACALRARFQNTLVSVPWISASFYRHVSGSELLVSSEYIYNHFSDCIDKGYYLCKDKIHDIITIPAKRREGDEFTPILACNDGILRVLDVSE